MLPDGLTPWDRTSEPLLIKFPPRIQNVRKPTTSCQSCSNHCIRSQTGTKHIRKIVPHETMSWNRLYMNHHESETNQNGCCSDPRRWVSRHLRANITWNPATPSQCFKFPHALPENLVKPQQGKTSKPSPSKFHSCSFFHATFLMGNEDQNSTLQPCSKWTDPTGLKLYINLI